MNGELRRRLRSLGQSPTPAPDATFADRLEAELRASSPVVPGGGPGPSDEVLRRRLVPLRLAAAALVLLVLAAGAVAVRAPGGELATFGDSPARPGPPQDGPPAQEDPAPDDDAVAATTTTAAAPATNDVGRTDTTTTTTTGAAAPRATTSTTVGDDGAETIDIRAVERDGVVMVGWSTVDDPAFAAYLVLRADAPSEPRYPTDDATEVVAVVRDRSMSRARDVHESASRPVYRVVAVDRAGRELARSPATSPVGEHGTESGTTR